jgi:hypothetical protein
MSYLKKKKLAKIVRINDLLNRVHHYLTVCAIVIKYTIILKEVNIKFLRRT